MTTAPATHVALLDAATLNIETHQLFAEGHPNGLDARQTRDFHTLYEVRIDLSPRTIDSCVARKAAMPWIGGVLGTGQREPMLKLDTVSFANKAHAAILSQRPAAPRSRRVN